MERRVQILPSALIDQIAAGEVVERPASVVKELVENSLDAGAGTVSCQVVEGGRDRIRVTDDGAGMSREDVLLAVKRHATSKIATPDDLTRIATLGFRGEALPSIAAVSRMRIVTCRRGDDLATELTVEGGSEPRVADAGAPVGTDVVVSDLFFNTPARRKFLRTRATEIGHIQSWITRLALMRPEVHLRLQHGERRLLDAPGTSDLAQRTAVVLGREVFEHLVPVAYAEEGIRVDGLISGPDHNRPNPRAVHLFVNGRFVRDRLLQHAVMDAYRSVLPQGRFPTVVLRLDVDPEVVDVNVHPQKTEVRFEDTRRVHRVVMTAVGEVLARAPWLARARRTYRLDTPAAPADDRAGRVREAMARFERAPKPASSARQGLFRSPTPPRTPAPDSAPAAAGAEAGLSEWHLVGTLWNTYLFLASGDTLVVVDQHAAAERITFERLKGSTTQGEIRSQRLLVPMQIEVDGKAAAVVEDHRERLARVGFEIEPFGPGTINVTAVPALLAEASLASLVRDTLDEMAEQDAGAPWEQARLEVLGRMACHASVRAGQALGEQEIRALLGQLDAVDYRGTCPHGRPVLVTFGRTGVERWFRRT